jgi:dTDP-4-amino-4,6-dideoxygalactose transaminase
MKKLKKIVNSKIRLAKILSKELANLPGLQVPQIRKNCTHNYYVYPLVINENCKIKRKKLIKKLKDKKIPGIIEGYQNLHLQPIYQNKIAYGKKHFPWSIFKSSVSYKKGICPVAEQLHEKRFWGILMCSYDFSERDIKEISKIIKKIWYGLLK